MNERKVKALEKLAGIKNTLEMKARLLPLIIEGIKNVSHHKKITVKLEQSVKEFVPYCHVSYYRGSLKIWDNKTIANNDDISIYGETHGELLSNAAKMDFSTEKIDKTIANLEILEAVEEELKALKASLEVAAPAIWALREVQGYEQIYKLHAL